ncbi:breast cancer type 2 susceptibility protein isoform X2 [Melanotaenia boesemani]|uniref:breast cancer type 2 susceptibility protein isoform X2 n=1 Tax=Melanotaenia boesemani TaxID=1250792 RepID=UPI001C045F6F|nr:breast cancer type 2 susceptibility protein isoform X2 [Melanotaenia boesemani]
MDLCSEDMYDIFKGEVWKELGPVDPNWFEILTAQAPIIEETVTDRDDLCANQEGNFKIPLDKAAADTQLFSTPKVFRRSQIVSPDTEDEQSFTAPQEKGTLPWMVTQSPCLFQDSKVGDPGVKCGGFQSQNDNSFELLNTPKKSPVSYAQHISESLGAQINPDISWTSSLNTPPALPSTLILSKADDESPCPASVTADRNVVFVRKLFPSLSKESTVMETKNKNKPAVSQGAGNCGVHESPQTTLNQSEGIWQQKVPDANEDEELQSTEAGVLDGAENVPSMLFANSNSALRKVKPDRIKRRQSIQTEENDCSSKDVSTTHSEEVTSDVEPGTFSSSPPVKTGDTAVSQWSPLNLSEIPACTVENNILTEKLQGNTDSNQPARPLVKITESVFIRKKRKFVYTVGTLKPQVQGEEPHSQKMDLLKMPESGQDVTIKQLKKAPNEADCCNTGKSAVKKQLKLHGENLLQSAEVKVQGLDMSQLCRDFAQDFSQVSDSDDQVKVAEDIQHDFSPSACLSAMKQAKQKARQADLHRSYDGTSHGKTSTSNQNTCEHAINDSGFHSAVLNTTHMTTSSYGLPCSENTGQSREWSGFKADSHITAPSLFTKKENEKVHLDAGAEPTLMSGQRKQTQVLGEKSESHTESTSTQQPISTKGAADNMYRAPINGQIHPHLPEKTAASLPSGYASGFKTASNKGIQISSANLERAKRLFEETEGAKTFIDQSTKCDRATKYKTCMSNGSVKSTTAETSSSQLTASQRADVTELCSLLEEADSQFEFTQFKTAKVKEHCQYGTNSPKKMDKEIDPDFLAGIDFDDSFNSDAEDHLKVNVMPNSKHIAECERCPNHLYRAEHSEAAKLEKSATLMLDVAFKTAGENVLRVSKKCLNKARTLFADLEKSPTEKSPNNQNNEMEEKFNMDSNMCKKDLKFTLKDDHHVGRKIQNVEESVCSNKQVTGFGDDIKSLRNSKIDTTICQSGFHMASGKQISISAKYMQQADALFKDCDVMDCNDGTSNKKSIKHVAESVESKKSISKFNNLESNISEEQVKRFKRLENANAELAAHHTDEPHVDKVEIGSNCSLALKNAASLHRNTCSSLRQTTSKNIDSSVVEWSSGDGFCTASGKKVSVSAVSMKMAECLLGEIHTPVDTKREPDQIEKTSRTEQLTAQVLPPKNSGFQTASAKEVTISEAALKKAKTLFQECEELEDKSSALPPLYKVKVTGPPVMNSGFSTASGKAVAFSSETLQKAESLLSDISFSAEIPDVSHTKTSDKSGDVAEKRHLGFTTAGGAKVHVSQKSLLKAKHFFQNFDISASAKAAQEAGPFEEPGNGSTMDMIRQVKQKEDTFLQQNGGFQTAGGKAVAVSSQALMRAKTMLSGYEGGENEMGVLLPQVRNTVTGPFLERSGFSAASGKPVAFSSEALQKAKALFSDISLHTDKPAVSDTRRSDKKHEDAQNITEKIHSGFTTAGRGVHVSEESLFKTGNLLREFAGGECHYSDSNSTSPRDLQKLDLSKVKDVKRTSNSGVPGVRNEEIPAKRETSSEVTPFSLHEINQLNKTVDSFGVQGSSFIKDKTLTDVFTHQEDKIVPLATTHLHISSGPVKSHVVDCDITERSEVECSDLNLQSVNLTGCTETQQKFLAQEALDCTKALLEDESLAGQSLSVTSENRSLQDDPKVSNRSPEEENRTRKRIMGDADLISQPPLKRRLLEEFDRTVDGAKASVLHPVKSCPNGLMKDRGVFKYNTSLQPNITKPHRDEKRYIDIKFQKTTPTDGSATGGSRSSHFKMPAFVPPLIKNTKPVTQKIPALKENASTPVFIPPFKKQRTVLEESISQQQDEEDKCQQISQSHSNTHVPPSKKLQGTTHDAANNSLMNNQGVLVDCQSVSSGAEASHVDDAFSRSQDVDQNLENIELARDMQDMRIRKKKRQTIRPLPGSLFLTKTSGVMRIPLKVAVNGKPPTRCTSEQLYEYGVQRHVSEVRSESAESFRFNLLQFIRQETLTDGGGVQLADGGWLIPSNDWTAGKEEFYRALCDTPGVDPKLISEAWVYNHYRWIVWKQASMEKSFPETMGSFCLTPEQVLLQLKYRYDVEVDHSRRPALRKIMEKDDTAAKTIVLCVSEIVSRGQSPEKQSCNNKTPQTADAKVETLAVVWLTDGWYAIKAQLDEPLTAMLHKGLLAVGGKLIINGAQLVGSQDACSPLEAPESLMLKICANSCRRARWNAKLGFHRDPRPFLLPISSFYSNGGPVGCVDIVMLRSYPIQWMERKPDGSVVFRSTRAEEKEARQYDNHKHKAMEVLFAKIQAEFEKEKGNIKPQRRKQVSHQNIRSLQDGEELYEAIGDDPADLEAHLSEQQLEIFHSYRRSLMEKKHAELQDRYRRAVEAEDNDMNCPKRDVSPVWRISIADSLAQPSCVYQLNLWQPSADLRSLLKEGSRYKVYNLITSDGKKRSSIHTIQLTGTKKTQFQDLQASREWLLARFQPRVSTNFVNLQNTEFQPLCGEVDLTGYVISVIDGQGSSPAFYLADEKLNFVKVRCFSSLSQAGLEDVVKPCVLLALSNLQLRGQSIHPTPVVYAGDLTVFSTNPKEVHLQESFSHLKNLVQCQENFFLKAEDKLSHLVRSDGLSSISLALLPQTPTSTTDRRQDSKTSVTHQKPIRNLGSFTPVNRNPPAGTSSTKKDPVNLKRRRALDYLSRIPSPPPLSLLGSLASPTVNKTFNPPRRSGTPSTLKNAPTPIKKPTDSLVEDEWVNDEELAMIDTQALHGGDLK